MSRVADPRGPDAPPPDPAPAPSGPARALALVWSAVQARATRRLAPVLAILAFAAWILWPVPSGVMPLSADHTVHLTRIVLTAERLASSASLSGWEPTWFFGFPLGDLYPQLGDLLIIAIHHLSLGLLDWPGAYALGFFVVFAVQGLALLRVGRLFGYGAWPGLLAGLLILADPGFTREGGWMYTVYFGVWPQALATSLAWWGLAEMAHALGWRPSMRLASANASASANDNDNDDDDDGTALDDRTTTRATVLAGLAFGAALLAHPIALPTLAMGGLLLALSAIPRGPRPWREALARCLFAGLLGAALAAWWWVPMLQNRAWMASYGWLFVPLETMQRWVIEGGQFAQRMPAAVGYAAAAGLVLAALGAGKSARFVALFTVSQWLLASSDAFWELRLDRLSEGFTHIQYQRFLIGAKPGLYLCAGLAVSAPLAWAWRLLQSARAPAKADASAKADAPRLGTTLAARLGPARRPVFAVLALGLAGLSAAVTWTMVADSRAALDEFAVGQVQVQRAPKDPELDEDYRAFTVWAADQWGAREADYRLAFRAPRNSHWAMDAPVWTGTPQYKMGFTPGDNFVHKPESARPELLDALGVRWIVSRDKRGQNPDGSRAEANPRRGEVARFGSIVVKDRPRAKPWPLVQLRDAPEDTHDSHDSHDAGDARVEIVEDDLRGGRVRATLHGPDLGGRQVVFAVAGYPRWQLELDGEALAWEEVPVFGEGPRATPALRREGGLRGGKAKGDDGSEPTLIAATLPPGTPTGASLELHYQTRTLAEGLAELLSLLAWLVALGAALFPQRFIDARERAEALGAAILHPAVVAGAALSVGLLGGQRWWSAKQREATTLLGWVEAGALTPTRAHSRARVETGPVKTAMLIRPAVIMRPTAEQPAQLELRLEALPAQVTGWVGLDDDQAQQRGRWAKHALHLEVRPVSADPDDPDSWSTLARVSVPHQPQRIPLTIEVATLSAAGELSPELAVGQPCVLRITDEARGKRRARLGLNLDLGQLPGPAR